MTTKLVDLAIRSGLRKKKISLEGNEKHLGSLFRKDVMIAHGFRKFFTTQLVDLNINPELRWLLQGHNLKGQ